MSYISHIRRGLLQLLNNYRTAFERYLSREPQDRAPSYVSAFDIFEKYGTTNCGIQLFEICPAEKQVGRGRETVVLYTQRP